MIDAEKLSHWNKGMALLMTRLGQTQWAGQKGLYINYSVEHYRDGKKGMKNRYQFIRRNFDPSYDL